MFGLNWRSNLDCRRERLEQNALAPLPSGSFPLELEDHERWSCFQSTVWKKKKTKNVFYIQCPWTNSKGCSQATVQGKVSGRTSMSVHQSSFPQQYHGNLDPLGRKGLWRNGAGEKLSVPVHRKRSGPRVDVCHPPQAQGLVYSSKPAFLKTPLQQPEH